MLLEFDGPLSRQAWSPMRSLPDLWTGHLAEEWGQVGNVDGAVGREIEGLAGAG
ncbi:MAG: hypothetical protein IID43_06550 [Planctomycetes bacterium]|nr:hypothetical protein [Planctomycetota bacterium]